MKQPEQLALSDHVTLVVVCVCVCFLSLTCLLLPHMMVTPMVIFLLIRSVPCVLYTRHPFYSH